MSSMTIKTFLGCAKALPANISIMTRGETGIGKSQITRKLARHFKLPVIDRRLSQMTEGDMIGLPSTDGNVTRFNPPDWYKTCCDSPHVLYLDELNRGTPETMQAAFQIVLDRELNGWKLHPETRVYCSINAGAQYTVNEVDPALLRRFWVIDLEPTLEDWVEWATAAEEPIPDHPGGKISDELVDFLRTNVCWLDPPSNPDPGKVHPTRHSWQRLDASVKAANLFDGMNKETVEKPEGSLLYSLSLGFIGTEAAIALLGYFKTIDSNVTADDVLNKGYDKVKAKLLKAGQEKMNILSGKVAELVLTHNKITKKQGENLEKMMWDLPFELRINMWQKLVSPGHEKIDLIRSFHKYVVPAVLDVFGVPYGEAGLNVTPKIPQFMQDQK